MSTNTDNSEIRRILDKIKAEYNIGVQNEIDTASGGREFTFGEPEVRGLEFLEVSAEAEPREDVPTYTPSFVDTLPVDEQYDMPTPVEPMPRIYHTYVPRFTGASDSYRVAPSKKEETPTANVAIPTPTVTRAEETNSFADDEEFSAYEGAQLVNVTSGNAEEKSELLSVRRELNFEKKPTPERTLADEEADIKELVGSSTPLVEEPVSEQASEIPEPELTLPDPTPEPMLPDPLVNTYVLEESHASVEDDYTPTSSGKRGARAEYTSLSQRTSFKDRFLDTEMSMRVRLVAAGILTLLLMLLENLSLFGLDTVSFLHLNSLPGALALVELQFVLCLFALAIPEVVRFVRAMLQGRVRAELLYVLAFFATFLYCLLIAILKPTSYSLFGSVFGIFTVATVFGAYLYESAAFMSFKLISIGGTKHAVQKSLTRTLARENMALDGAVDEYNSCTAKMLTTSFVSDFFHHTAKRAERTRELLIYASVTLGVALTAGVVAYFVPGGAVSAISTFVAVLLLSAPVFLLLLHKLPFYYAQRVALAEDSTFLGEGSAVEYAGVDVVTFEDTEIFGAEDVALKRIILYDDKRNFTKAMRQMSSLFASVGGPLAEIFASALDNKIPPAAQRVQIEDDGVCGEINGAYVFAGSEAYMERHGILVPTDEQTARGEAFSTMKVMYAAEDGKIYAKFHVRYSFSEEFTMLLSALKEANTVSLVYTADPNVDAQLLSTLTTGEDTVRVIKRTSPATAEKTHKSVSAGVVTMGDKTCAINMILLAKKYAKFNKRLLTLASVALGSGAALAVALSLFVSTRLPSLAFAVWQLLWVAVCWILSLRTFRE